MPGPQRTIADLLADALDQIRRKPDLRQGVVTGTSGTQVVVTVGNTSITMPYQSWYTPVASDNVNVLSSNGQWLCLGTVA